MKMNTKASTLLSAFVFLTFFHLSLVSCRKTISDRGENGFTLDLIHRDSPHSPFYNPSNTQSNRLRNAFHRSFSRASFFKKSSLATPNTIQSDISLIPGEYLMKLSIGTPPVEIVAIADTGSDLTWTQCKPCENCFEQSSPLFDSKKSSTYKTAGCDVEECTSIGSSSCVKGNVCEYQMSYGDQSHTIGDLAFDKFTFPSTSGKDVAIPNVAFGCGHDNGGTFNNYTSGIIGLGGGEVSIINQLDKEINGKFSYCLISIPLDSPISNVTSHINFGSSATVSGPDVVSTPLIKKDPSTFYYLNLEGVSVGNKTLKYKSSKIGSGGEEGNIIIDSGTTLTFLPNDFYSSLESTLVDSISATRKEDPSGTFRLCYESENGTIDAPTIVTHFANADLELSPSSTFAEIEQDDPYAGGAKESHGMLVRQRRQRVSFWFEGSGDDRRSLVFCEGSLVVQRKKDSEGENQAGDLSIETFTFASTCGENISIPNIAFGCGHANRDSFTNNAIFGIIGLGGGNVSIVNQMNKEIKGKFSYCFIPLELLLDSSNHINFGDNAVVLGPDVVSTPLILREEDPISYYLTLESISIGNKTLPFRSSKISPNDQGNIIIDFGTTYTFVPFDFYANLEKTLVSLINATRKNVSSGFLKLCYESQNGTINVPKIVAHFTNADIVLPTTNTFTQLDECLVCFTMLHDDEIAIFGKLAQMNFLIVFDLVGNKVSFLPTDCTKH
ncbi:hypothetical protein MTR67_033809 [Solanum verrucosum]|uniref:Peptidase A1 domain-containing protein n=1 Tax=Solanum verrucosum TaxID=315347 RepID=A0AAF0U7B0_SOLVR|nr:hypothetical protein MTR67_033809 [Solanum verrucosum]